MDASSAGREPGEWHTLVQNDVGRMPLTIRIFGSRVSRVMRRLYASWVGLYEVARNAALNQIGFYNVGTVLRASQHCGGERVF